jgi:hypothetical protein
MAPPELLQQVDDQLPVGDIKNDGIESRHDVVTMRVELLRLSQLLLRDVFERKVFLLFGKLVEVPGTATLNSVRLDRVHLQEKKRHSVARQVLLDRHPRRLDQKPVSRRERCHWIGIVRPGHVIA